MESASSKAMTRFTFILPESFHPLDYLQAPRLWCYADDARYLVSTILTKTARGHVDLSGLVRLKAEYLHSVMDKHHYRVVLDALLEGKVVVRHPYCPGERAYGYALGGRFATDKHVRTQVANPRVVRRLERLGERERAEARRRLKPIHEELERRQRRLQIHGDMARAILAALPPESNPWDVQGILVRDIESRNYHLHVGRYGRVTNNITSLKREVRRALHHNGRDLRAIDIKSSQPALLAQLARRQAEQRKTARQRENQHAGGAANRQGNGTSIYDSQPFTPLVADFWQYYDLAEQGQLYEFLRGELAERGVALDREAVKRMLLCDVIAKRKANGFGAEYPSAMEDVFRSSFPTVYRFIRQVNRDGWEHANLIRLLQREESRLVIETVCANLVRQHPRAFFITLHDAIYCTAEDVPKVLAAFDAAFQAEGFRMKLSVGKP